MKLKFPEISNLTQRFMLGVIPVSLAGIVLLGISAFYITKIHITRSVGKEIEVFSQGASSSISSFFKQRQNDIETISETSLLADYYNNADYGLTEEAEQYRQELERYFLKFSRRTDVYLSIVYVNSKGREICRIQDSGIEVPKPVYADKVYLRKTLALKKGSLLNSPISVEPGRGPRIYYSKPVFDTAGAARGIIVMEAGLKPLQAALSRLRVGLTGKTYIVDSRNHPVLAETDSTGNILDLPSDFKSSVPIFGTDLRVNVLARMIDFDAPLNTIRKFTLVFSIFAGGLVWFAIYFMIRRMTQPIKQLVEATEYLAQGRPFKKLEIRNRDEIGVLADSFNSMAELLAEKKQELELRIRELLVLQDMSSDVIKKLDTDHVCRICLKAAVAGLGFERGVLYLINKERTHIVGKTVHATQEAGFSEKQIRERIIPLNSEDILAEVVRTKKAVIIENPADNPRVNKRFIEEVATKAFCLVPVIAEQKVLGIIGVDNHYSGKRITREQMNKLMLFGNFTALALENADLMTGVRMSEERYRTVLDNTPDAIVGLDASFHVTVWNRGAQTLFGYAPAEITGRLVSALFTPLAFEAVMKKVVEKGFFSDSCVEGLTSIGKKLELDITWAGSGKWNNSEKEWTIVIRDTSEQRKLQAQLIQAEKLSAVGQLISGVAHELNNPLTVILGNSELLHKSGSDPICVPAPIITEIYESAHRCGEIVKNLLAFVRESRKQKQAINVPQIVRNSIALMAYKLKKTENISITQTENSHIPPVMGDFHQIEQILVNLIQNACDALTEIAGEKKINISVCHRVNSVLVAVSDNGPGIPKELQSRIFEPFFTTKNEGQGTGLGLAICRRIADEHGAHLTCASVMGRGATFTLEIPIVKIPDNTAVKESETARKPLPGKKVLVVDDEADIVGMMKRMLESEGQIVYTAASGPEAIEKLKNAIYDVVICDVEMGPSKGFSVREAMLEMDSPAGFIFTTGNLLNPALLAKLKESQIPFLPKPFNTSELLFAMNEALPREKN
jgi:two-component system NtrC family sensor kinase